MTGSSKEMKKESCCTAFVPNLPHTVINIITKIIYREIFSTHVCRASATYFTELAMN